MADINISIRESTGELFSALSPCVDESVSLCTASDGYQYAMTNYGSLLAGDLLIQVTSIPFIEGFISMLVGRPDFIAKAHRLLILSDSYPSELTQTKLSSLNLIWMRCDDSAHRQVLYEVFSRLSSLNHIDVICGAPGLFEVAASCHKTSDRNPVFMLAPTTQTPQEGAAFALSPSLWDSDVWLIESPQVDKTTVITVTPIYMLRADS